MAPFGIYFSASVLCLDNHLMLSVSLHINTASNQQILLLSDELGVIPWRSYVDFALVDDGGRNLHVDVIVRSAMGDNHPDVNFYKTRRTCMQDYTTYNGFLDGELSIGHSFFQNPGMEIESGVYLQNMCISEVPITNFVQFGPVLPSEWDSNFDKPILFEGMDAAMAARYVGQPSGSGKVLRHPQLAGLDKIAGDQASSPYWHRICYEDSQPLADSEAVVGYIVPHMKGEFWMSRSDFVTDPTYYVFSSSVCAQALHSCVVVRFSTSSDYLTLIESKASNVLRLSSIPTSGVVCGVEEDADDPTVLRMFVEHRGNVIDDMIIGEISEDLKQKLVVHQEIYNTPDKVLFRVSLVWPSGWKESSVLSVSSDKIQDPTPWEQNSSRNSNSANAYQRFPISAAMARHDLKNMHRVFVYSAVPLEKEVDGVSWKRPFVESVVIAKPKRSLNPRPPFECQPASIS
eukprot:gene659-963_t